MLVVKVLRRLRACAVALAWFESYSIECRMVNPAGFSWLTGTTQRAGGLSESESRLRRSPFRSDETNITPRQTMASCRRYILL